MRYSIGGWRNGVAPDGGAVRGAWWTVGWPKDRVIRVETDQVVLTFVGEPLVHEAAVRTLCAGLRAGWLAGLAELGGSYLAVAEITTPTGATTVVAGDLAGVHRVYWTPVGGRPVWSSSQTALAAAAGIDVDLVALASGLAAPALGLATSGALFPGLQAVAPGFALLVRDGTAQVRDIRVPRELDFDQGADLLGSALRYAVAARIAGEGDGLVGCDLSGGLDSGTLTVLAARPDPRRVLAVTFADPQLTDSTDVRIAAQVAKELGVRQEVVSPAEALHFGEMDAALPLADTPTMAYGTVAVKRAQFAPLIAAGVRVHLTGRGGDNLTNPGISVLPDLARCGHPLMAAAQAAAWARARNRAPGVVLAQLATQTMAPQVARRRAVSAVRTGVAFSAAMAPVSVGVAAGWLSLAARRVLADRIVGFVPAGDANVGFMAASHAGAAQLAAEWGLELAAPFLDSPVLAAATAVPLAMRTRAGKYKPLLKAALAAEMPAVLRERADKTAFNASLHAGLAAHHRVLSRLVENSRLAAAGVVDARAVAADLAAARNGATKRLASLHALFAAECWLGALSRHEFGFVTAREG